MLKNIGLGSLFSSWTRTALMALAKIEMYIISLLLVLGFESNGGVASVIFNYRKISSHSSFHSIFFVFLRRFMISLALFVILSKNLVNKAILSANLCTSFIFLELLISRMT